MRPGTASQPSPRGVSCGNDPERSEYHMDHEELINKIQSRDKTDGERLERIYEISFRDKKNFDLTLRNETFNLSQLQSIIEELLIQKYPPK